MTTLHMNDKDRFNLTRYRERACCYPVSRTNIYDDTEKPDRYIVSVCQFVYMNWE